MMQQKVLYLLAEAGGKTYWNRAGVGFQNSDGSFNIKLDMFPTLTFNLRDPKAKPAAEEGPQPKSEVEEP